MKLLNEYSDYETLFLVVGGLSYAVYVSDSDRKIFSKYKDGILEDISDEKKREMEVLLLLERLGYPMDELGTYLYKNMIIEVVKHLDKVSTRQGIINCKYFIAKLKDSFSDIYLNLARFELEMGIKTFHKNVLEAISKIDYSKADPNLLYTIFSKIPKEIDYAEQAFVLGSYISGKLELKAELEKVEELEVPKVKKLVNMPNID